MLIPSIDLQDGRIVQLVQGEELAIQVEDPEEWFVRFAKYPRVQLIDLDAARGTGSNLELVKRICGRLPCRVGGGVRSIERAREILDAGAHAVIVSSALFAEGEVDTAFATELAAAVGADRVIAAVDSRHGQVVIHGWKTPLPITPYEAIRALERWCGEFLYTHVDREGLMRGPEMEVLRTIRASTRKRVTVAGGITTQAEVDLLDSEQMDAVVGMAIYSGRLPI
jgi:phosphoribosylformimino-5-aminoimidazole carboxamide ribotide isomerase